MSKRIRGHGWGMIVPPFHQPWSTRQFHVNRTGSFWKKKKNHIYIFTSILVDHVFAFISHERGRPTYKLRPPQSPTSVAVIFFYSPRPRISSAPYLNSLSRLPSALNPLILSSWPDTRRYYSYRHTLFARVFPRAIFPYICTFGAPPLFPSEYPSCYARYHCNHCVCRFFNTHGTYTYSVLFTGMHCIARKFTVAYNRNDVNDRRPGDTRDNPRKFRIVSITNRNLISIRNRCIWQPIAFQKIFVVVFFKRTP